MYNEVYKISLEIGRKFKSTQVITKFFHLNAILFSENRISSSKVSHGQSKTENNLNVESKKV